MDLQAKKLELIDLLLHTNEESLLDRVKKVFESKQSLNKPSKDIIVAHTVDGDPLNVVQYQEEIQKGLDDVKAGRVTSDEDLAKEIETW